jgi:hypothetical protein
MVSLPGCTVVVAGLTAGAGIAVATAPGADGLTVVDWGALDGAGVTVAAAPQATANNTNTLTTLTRSVLRHVPGYISLSWLNSAGKINHFGSRHKIPYVGEDLRLQYIASSSRP